MRAGLGLSTSKPRTTEEWDGILNEHQIDELCRLADNPILLEAIEKVVCYELVSEGVFEKDKPFDSGQNYILNYVQELGGVLNNERLGQDVRALMWGVLRLREGIQNIRGFKKQEKVGESENPGI